MQPGFICLQQGNEWLLFEHPLEVLEVCSGEALEPALHEIETWIRSGDYAAGFISYEAAPGFDKALTVRSGSRVPQLWFARFDRAIRSDSLPHQYAEACTTTPWESHMDEATFIERIARIKSYIAQGHSYQVNFSFPLHAHCSGYPWDFFRDRVRAQGPAYAGFIDTGHHWICSASPELFFQRKADGTLLTRPMKGTSTRGRFPEEDRQHAADLKASPKDRAENLMITDMLRNDLGRIAEPGSVETPKLFEIETYPTLFQMTSTVTARSTAGFADTLAALFPCASVTGAPKVRSMEIIHELESAPRGLYTGAIGYWAPDGEALFNVAIRTTTIDQHSGEMVYPVGAGIVWDSDPAAEYRECLDKALVLEPPVQPTLFETLRWEPETGYFLEQEHLERLEYSARHFGYPFEPATWKATLQEAVAGAKDALRVRVECRPDGSCSWESGPLPKPQEVYRATLDDQAVDQNDWSLFHKTTQRDRYEAASQREPSFDDVILWNHEGELTESTRANLVLRFGERYITPPLSCGLLPGTFRARLLAEGKIVEDIIRLDDLEKADDIFLINALRKWMPTHITLPVNEPSS